MIICAYAIPAHFLFRHLTRSEDCQLNAQPYPALWIKVCEEPNLTKIMTTSPVNIYLVGKTGTGKSATGNSLLGRQAFESGPSTTSITATVSAQSAEIEGRRITVVDGPGIGDTGVSREQTIIESSRFLEEVMSACPDGYHALLLVFRYGTRFTEEDRATLATLKILLGKDFVRKHAILVVTCGDNLIQEMGAQVGGEAPSSSLFSQWLNSQSGDLAALVEELEGRAVLFNNMSKEANILSAQRGELFKAVDNLCNQGLRYSQNDFLACSMSRQIALVETKAEKVSAETKTKLDKISSEMTTVMSKAQASANDISSKLGQLEALFAQIKAVLQSVEEQDEGTGALNNVKAMVEAQRKSVDDAVQGIKVLLQQRKQQDKEEEERRRAQAEMLRQQEEMRKQAELRQQEEARQAEERRLQQEAENQRREAEAKQREQELQRQLAEEQEKRKKLEAEEAARRAAAAAAAAQQAMIQQQQAIMRSMFFR
ncbi:immune-associated nucleotide-binding protein 6 [Plakobranchus ocellatus]|uniref:Immune-associated nucleotide-binding protein 6 n=1 Tax=Plakobranchus ocellatus TaxID=259542 RepID=A0AAV3Z2T8_9GAST|nr:immune-associated nucleotide-binding protein 6 [Plakobranchus ocellatus]